MLFKVMEILPAVEAWRETFAADTAIAHEPSEHRAEELQEGDRDQAHAGVRQVTVIASASMSVTIIKATAAESDSSHIWSL